MRPPFNSHKYGLSIRLCLYLHCLVVFLEGLASHGGYVASQEGFQCINRNKILMCVEFIFVLMGNPQ